jgi:hypothetical protein
MSYVSEVEGSILPPGADDPPPPRPRSGLVVALAAALAIAIVAAGVLAVRLYRAEHLDGGQASARDLVERYTVAVDRHDLDGVHVATLDQASFTEAESLRSPMLGPYTRDDRDAFFVRLFAADVRLRSTAPPTVVGDGPYRVAVRQTVHYVVAGIDVDEEGMSLFTVVDSPQGPLISDHVWWRLPRPPKPSMAWIE